MQSILKRSRIFITLLLAGLLLYMHWYSIKADRHDETAIPYLESGLPKLASWQYAQLEPLLSPSAQAAFANAKVRAAYQAFARLGQLQSMERPEFMGERSGNSDVLGDIELIAYQVPLQFDTGPALIKINLATDGKFYYIEHFSLQSEIFTDSASGN